MKRFKGKFEDLYEEIKDEFVRIHGDFSILKSRDCYVDYVSGKYLNNYGKEWEWNTRSKGDYEDIMFAENKIYKIWVMYVEHKDYTEKYIAYVEPTDKRIYQVFSNLLKTIFRL